jgi:hypothetical protein
MIEVLLSVLLFAHAYPAPGALSEGALKGGYGVADRAKVIAEAPLLPGKVICPDDPNIVLAAKGYPGKTAIFEADRVHYDARRVAQALSSEIDSADYVIVMRQVTLPDGEVLTPRLSDGQLRTLCKRAALSKSDFGAFTRQCTNYGSDPDLQAYGIYSLASAGWAALARGVGDAANAAWAPN